MDWDPQAPITAFQACHKHFVFENQHVFFQKGLVLSQVVLLSYLIIMFILETPKRRAMQFLAGELTNFVLSSHVKPIGDQNDV